jgi:hypothetical protein
MLRSGSRYHSLGSSTGSVSWMISFGDLLTLLVCFFILLTPNAFSPVSKNELKQQVVSSVNPQESIGTDLAPKAFVGKDSHLKPIPVWRSNETAPSSGDGLKNKQWQRDLVERVAGGSKARIELCDVRAEREIFIETLKDLRSLGVQASRAQFELGANCENWRAMFAEDRELLAVVNFSGN